MIYKYNLFCASHAFKCSVEFILYIWTTLNTAQPSKSGNYRSSLLGAHDYTWSKRFKTFQIVHSLSSLCRTGDEMKGLKLVSVLVECIVSHRREVRMTSLSPLNSPLSSCSLSSLPDYHRFKSLLSWDVLALRRESNRSWMYKRGLFHCEVLIFVIGWLLFAFSDRSKILGSFCQSENPRAMCYL